MSILINATLIIIGVLLFCLLVFIHEFGHFSMAKLFKVRVNEFSLGMGPKLFKKQKGETIYSVRAFPIGGFCAMEGEDEDIKTPDAFGSKKVWQRILIVAMGGIFNIILGFVLMFILLIPQDTFATTIVAQFSDNASTQISGLMPNDEITAFDGYKVNCDKDLVFAMSLCGKVREAINSGSQNECYVDIDVFRENEEVSLKNVKFDVVQKDDGSKYLNLDFKVYGEKKTFFNIFSQSFKYTVSTVRMVWASLVGLITGNFGINDMAGPVGTATAISQSAVAGLADGYATAVSNIVYVMVILTVNLGIFNLLPIPALDGGRLVFLIIEAIARKPVPAKFERLVHATGFALLIAFMFFITYNDIVRLITGSGVSV